MATPTADQQRRRDAALAAGGALAATVGAEAAASPPAAARKTAIASILAALVSFLTAKRTRDEQVLRAELAKRGPVGDVDAVIAEEMVREEEFARRAAERFTVNMSTALAIPDPQMREAAVRGLLGRESFIARQRSQAMFARAIAAVERRVLRQASPNGAFWKLDPTVIEHTAGCLIMGNKFWPWAVLDRVHPPRHAGCPCRLKSYGEAIHDGDMTAGDVMNVRDAIRSTHGVVMEAAIADQLLEELDLRDALVEQGLATAAALAAIPLAGLEESFTEGDHPRDPGGQGGGQFVKKLKLAADASKSIDEAHAAISSVVNVPSSGIPIEALPETDTATARLLVSKRSIGVHADSKALTQKTTLVHEFAHFLDNFLASSKSADTDHYASEQDDKALWKVLRDSPPVKAIIEDKVDVLKGDPQRMMMAQGREAFARAFEQFIATRSGDKDLLAALHRTRDNKFLGFQYWSDADFKPIETAMEKFLRDRGLLKGKKG